MTNRNKRPHSLIRKGIGFVLSATIVGAMSASATADSHAKMEAAKEKGQITWYTSVWPEQLRHELADDFRAQTGLDLVIGYAGGTGQVVTRIATERETGAYEVDVVDLVDEEVINALIDDGVLRAYKSPNRGNIISDCKDEAGYWAGFYFWALLMEYNTSRLNKEEVPKSWSELNDPKWKGKVVVADPYKSASGLGFVKGMVKLELARAVGGERRSDTDVRPGCTPVGPQGRATRRGAGQLLPFEDAGTGRSGGHGTGGGSVRGTVGDQRGDEFVQSGRSRAVRGLFAFERGRRTLSELRLVHLSGRHARAVRPALGGQAEDDIPGAAFDRHARS